MTNVRKILQIKRIILKYLTLLLELVLNNPPVPNDISNNRRTDV